MPILGAEQQLSDAVAVPVDGRRARVVPCQLQRVDRPGVAERRDAIVLAEVEQHVRVRTVDDEVELAVAVPVDDAELPAAAFPGDAGVQS